MADSSVAITPGSGASIDTRTESINGDHRQVVVIGDPVTGANVAQVSNAGAVFMQGYQSVRTEGTITTSTSVVGPIDVSNYNIITVTIRGTYAGVNVTFEASDDGTNYFSVLAARTDSFSAAATSGVITSNASWAWDIPIGAFTFFRVRATARTSGTATVGLTAQSMPYEPCPTVGLSGTSAMNIAQMNGVTVTMGNGTSGTGVQRVAIASDNTAFNVTANQPTPSASNINSAATTNASSVKASAGTVYSVWASNNGAAAAYLKLYNKASAPTVGTDVPVMVIPVPATGFVMAEVGTTGHRFTTGIALAITNLMPDSDTTAIAASQVKVMTTYI